MKLRWVDEGTVYSIFFGHMGLGIMPNISLEELILCFHDLWSVKQGEWVLKRNWQTFEFSILIGARQGLQGSSRVAIPGLMFFSSASDHFLGFRIITGLLVSATLQTFRIGPEMPVTSIDFAAFPRGLNRYGQKTISFQ